MDTSFLDKFTLKYNPLDQICVLESSYPIWFSQISLINSHFHIQRFYLYHSAKKLVFKTGFWIFFSQYFTLTWFCIFLKDLVNDLTREMISELSLQAVVACSRRRVSFLSEVWKNFTLYVPRIWLSSIRYEQCFKLLINVAIHTCFNCFNFFYNQLLLYLSRSSIFLRVKERPNSTRNPLKEKIEG